MRSSRVLAICALTASCAGCSGHSDVPARSSGRTQPAPAAKLPAIDPIALERELRAELHSLRKLRFVGMDDGPVPEFELRTDTGATIDSETIVGHEAFVVAFFATWCDLCERKLGSMERALKETGPMRIIPVSVDGPETWPAVSGYLEAAGIYEQPVRALDHPSFVLSYNPFSTVPLLVIVGRNGGLVDYQLGFEREHDARLVDSLRLAKTIGPLAKPSAHAAPTPE